MPTEEQKATYRRIIEAVNAGDLVAGRVTWRGTQAGPFVGAAPTGQSVAFEAYHIVRFEGGKAAEWWGTADIFGALAQLGALPAPGQTTGQSRPVGHTVR